MSGECKTTNLEIDNTIVIIISADCIRPSHDIIALLDYGSFLFV